MSEKETTLDSSDSDELEMSSVEDSPILENGTSREIIGRFIWLAISHCMKLFYKTFVWSLKATVLAGIILCIFYHQTIIAGLRQGNLLDRARQLTIGQSQSEEKPSGAGGMNSEAPNPDDDKVVVEPDLQDVPPRPQGPTQKEFRQWLSMQGNKASAKDPPSALTLSGVAAPPKETEYRADFSDVAPEDQSTYSEAAAIRAISKWARYYRIEFELAMAVAKHESNLEPLRTRFEPDYYRCHVLGQRGCDKIESPQAWKPMLKDESGRKMMATSWGLFQLMPATAASVASKEGILNQIQIIPELFNVDLNARLGIAYLKHCMDSSETFEEVGKCYNGSQSNDWWQNVSRQYVQFLRKDIRRPPD